MHGHKRHLILSESSSERLATIRDLLSQSHRALQEGRIPAESLPALITTSRKPKALPNSARRAAHAHGGPLNRNMYAPKISGNDRRKVHQSTVAIIPAIPCGRAGCSDCRRLNS